MESDDKTEVPLVPRRKYQYFGISWKVEAIPAHFLYIMQVFCVGGMFMLLTCLRISHDPRVSSTGHGLQDECTVGDVEGNGWPRTVLVPTGRHFVAGTCTAGALTAGTLTIAGLLAFTK